MDQLSYLVKRYAIWIALAAIIALFLFAWIYMGAQKTIETIPAATLPPFPDLNVHWSLPTAGEEAEHSELFL